MTDYSDYIEEQPVEANSAGRHDASDTFSAPLTVDLDEVRARSKINGSIGYFSDRFDFYSFTAPESGSTSVALTNLDGNLYVNVYDSLATSLLDNDIASSMGGDTADQFFNFLVDSGETYLVAVMPSDNTVRSSYNLQIDAPSLQDIEGPPYQTIMWTTT